jgi:hypothetical protein
LHQWQSDEVRSVHHSSIALGHSCSFRGSWCKFKTYSVLPRIFFVSLWIGPADGNSRGNLSRFFAQLEKMDGFNSSLGSLVVSLSDRTLAILRPDAENALAVTDSWVAHDFEPWIAAWDYWDVNALYSGAPISLLFRGATVNDI